MMKKPINIYVPLGKGLNLIQPNPRQTEIYTEDIGPMKKIARPAQKDRVASKKRGRQTQVINDTG
jgi:hypothetical protein